METKLNGNEIKVDRDALRVGMYVSSLDIPWEKTKYPIQGFFLATNSQVDELKNLCAYVVCLKNRSAHGIFKETVKEQPIKQQVPTSTNFSAMSKVEIESIEAGGSLIDFFFGLVGLPVRMVSFCVEVVSDLFDPNKKTVNRYTKTVKDKNNAINPSIEKAIKSIKLKDSVRTLRQFNNEPREINYYPVIKPLEQEIHAANYVKNTLIATLPDLVNEMELSSMSKQIIHSKEAMDEVVESLIRNPDAMQLISRMSMMDEQAVRNAIDVSFLMIAFGREIGLTKDELVEIGIGGLLHDIGMTKVLGGEFNKRQVKTVVEMKIYKEHVKFGLEALDEMKINNHIVRSIVANHHERYDASGFPNKLKGNEIGLYGSMAVICDAYVAYVSGSAVNWPITPSAAISKMLKQAGAAFHPQLMQQFIQVVGIYPVGSIVKLNTEETGIVISQNRLARLRPVLRIVLNKHGKRYKHQPNLDLKHQQASDIIISREMPQGHPLIQPHDFLLN